MKAAALVLLGASAVARAENPSATATAAPPPPAPHGLAVGIEAGDPSMATVGFFTGKLAAIGAVGSGTYKGLGLSTYLEVQFLVARLSPAVPLRIGIGERYYHHGYQPMSLDEIPDSHYGVFGSIALAYETGAMQLYLQAQPGGDWKRTASCTLADGPYSICPHAQESPFFLQLAVGARWFFSH